MLWVGSNTILRPSGSSIHTKSGAVNLFLTALLDVFKSNCLLEKWFCVQSALTFDTGEIDFLYRIGNQLCFFGFLCVLTQLLLCRAIAICTGLSMQLAPGELSALHEMTVIRYSCWHSPWV